MRENWFDIPPLRNLPDPQIIIAMSGGVDSAVAALKIKEAGFRCSALFIKSWDEGEDTSDCKWEDDVADAMDVCDRLGIPINTVDLTKDYWELVFKEFLVEISQGRTPNPDVLCNREIKFNTFKSHAEEFGADVLATGHYAKTRHNLIGVQLLKASDKDKDQSYFLHSLRQRQLRNVIFPLGDCKKQDIRKMAKAYGLKNHDKKDSTGICFIGERAFKPFLAQYLASNKGPIVDTEDRIIGEHDGAIFYTIGQRKGLGIGGKHSSRDEPWYVVDKILPENKIVAGQGSEHPALLSNTLVASKASWILEPPKSFPLTCHAKIRYRQSDQRCKISEMPEKRLKIIFDRQQRAITPGQSIVFYSGENCLGGALIEKAT